MLPQSAHKQAGEHIAFPIVSMTLTDFPSLLLNLLPHGTVHDWFVEILENNPIFTIILYTLLVFVEFGVCLFQYTSRNNSGRWATTEMWSCQLGPYFKLRCLTVIGKDIT